MKARHALILVAISSVLILIILGCALNNNPGASDLTRPVTIKKDHILFNGAKISAADQEQLNAVLKKYDKSLYRIRIYKEGKLGKTLGLLSEEIIGNGTVREVARNAKAKLLSGWTDQIGVDPVAFLFGRADRPHIPLPPPPRPLNREMLLTQSRELVRQLEPVIETYRSGSFGQER